MIILRKYHILIGIALILSVSGCTKNLGGPTGEITTLQINVEGVTDPIIPTDARRASSMANELSTTDPVDRGGFVSHIETLSASISTASNESETQNGDGERGIRRAAIPASTGYTYRIMLYRKSTGEFWKTVQAKAGTPAFLEAERGESYVWYAYSYNDLEDIPTPDNVQQPTVQTATTKTLMYASGEIAIPRTGQIPNNILGIMFQHKVTQISIKIDGRSLGTYAEINHLKAKFDQPNYIKRGVLDLKRNEISQIEVVPTDTIFYGASPTNTWERNYYTVDPSVLKSYKIVLHDLPVSFPEANAGTVERNLATYFGADNKPVFTSNFKAPAIGQRLISRIYLNYQPSPLRILHISNTASYGYALQHGPSWDFLNSKVNFGDLPESVVKIGSWSTNQGEGAWIGGTAERNSAENRMSFANNAAFANQVADRLAASNKTNRPDIVILGFNVTNINPTLGNALNSYLDDKGVVIMMLQEATNTESMTFFNRLFGGAADVGYVASGSGGTMYPIEGNDPNDVILNGPFGDVRTRHWGEDAGTTLGLTGIPPAQVTVYAYGNAINRAPVAPRVTMFKHKTKSFFYVGDGGFVAYTPGTAMTICPFRYDPVTKLPLPKPYGDGYGSAPARNSYNSIIMANVMAWAVKKAELEGIRVWRYAGPPKP